MIDIEKRKVFGGWIKAKREALGLSQNQIFEQKQIQLHL